MSRRLVMAIIAGGLLSLALCLGIVLALRSLTNLPGLVIMGGLLMLGCLYGLYRAVWSPTQLRPLRNARLALLIPPALFAVAMFLAAAGKTLLAFLAILATATVYFTFTKPFIRRSQQQLKKDHETV